MEFKSRFRSYLSRYFGTLLITTVMVIAFYLQSLAKGFSFYDVVKKFYFTDVRMTLFFLIIPFIYHINSYLITNKYPKLLKVSNDSIIFNFFKKPRLTINYSEIKSLEYSDKIRRDFVFILKNGDKKVIPSSVIGYERAFEEINKKIKENN